MLEKKYLLIFGLIFCLCLQTDFVFAISGNPQPKHQNQFDQDFKARYKGRKYDYEGKDIVGHTPYKNRKIADYKNKKTRIKEKNNENALSLNLGPLGWVFIFILIAAVGYLVYTLLNEGGNGLFSKRQHLKLDENGTITAENIESTDIQSLINKAEGGNDYRLAIRYYYLLVLKTLSIKNLIKFEDDKTNADYLDEINAQPFAKKFSYTSYLYNYTWYGEFDLTPEQYSLAKTDFINLINSIK